VFGEFLIGALGENEGEPSDVTLCPSPTQFQVTVPPAEISTVEGL